MIFWMRTNIRAVSSATVFYTLLVFLTQIADCKHIAFGRRIFDSCKTKSNYLVHFKLDLKLIWNTTIIGTIEKLFNLQSNWYNFVLFIHNIKTTVFQCLFMTTNFSGKYNWFTCMPGFCILLCFTPQCLTIWICMTF